MRERQDDEDVKVGEINSQPSKVELLKNLESLLQSDDVKDSTPASAKAGAALQQALASERFTVNPNA